MAGLNRIGLEAVLITGQFQKGMRIYLTGTDKLTSQTAKVGKVMSNVAAGALAGLGVALTGLAVKGFKEVIKEGAAFTKGMSNVAALTGATGKEFSNLENTAKTLGKTTKFSAVQASEGMAFLAQAGFEANEIVQAMPGTLNLAAAANVDLGKAADIVSNILTGFGATAESTGQFVDVLTQTFTTSNTNLTQLGQAMKNVAPVAASLGISVEDTAAALGKLGDAGIQGGRAGTALKIALLNLAAPTAQQADLMEELGIQIFDTNGEMLSLPQIVGNINTALSGLGQEQQIAAVKTLAGKRAIAGFQVLLNEGQSSLQTYGDTLRDSIGVASEIAAVQLDNLAGDVTLFQSALDGLEISTFELLETSLRGSTQASTEFVLAFDEAVVGLGKTQSALETTSVAIQNLTDGNFNLAEGIKQTILPTNALNTGIEVSRNVFATWLEVQLKATVAVAEFAVGSEKLGQAFTKTSGGLNTLTSGQNTFNRLVKVSTKDTQSLAENQRVLAKAELEVNEATRLAAQQSATYSTILEQQERAALDATIAQSQLNAELLNFGDVGLEGGIAATDSLQEVLLLQQQIAAQSIATRQGKREEEAAAVEAKVKFDTGAITSSINDGLQNIKSAISQVSGLTFGELLPTQETFRIDEWVRRLQSVAIDGKNEWVGAITEQFGGQEFFRPFEEAVASGDISAISTAAQNLVNGDSLFELMDIDGAVSQVEGLIAEQNLQERINNAILAAVTEGGVDAGGIGGQTVLNTLGLGEGADIETPITEAVSGIPEIINEALVTEEGTNPLLGLLGLGEEGTFNEAIAILTGDTIPAMGEAFAVFFQEQTLGFKTMLVSTQTWNEALLMIVNTTLPSLKTAITTTGDAVISKFTEINTKIKDATESVEELTKVIKNDFVKATERAIQLVNNWINALREANREVTALKGLGTGTGADRGLGFRHGVGFQTGTSPLGFRVPAGFPNDTFPINVTSGERIVVSPPGKSIEQVTGLGVPNVEINFGNVTISNGMELNMFEGRVTRAVTEGFAT